MKIIAMVVAVGVALAACKADKTDTADTNAKIGERVKQMFGKDPKKDAERATKKFAYEAYPLWGSAHPGKACPDKIADLYEWADTKDGLDPWGTPYSMTCGANLPAGAKGIAIVSAGEDGKLGTPDDIKSWE